MLNADKRQLQYKHRHKFNHTYTQAIEIIAQTFRQSRTTLLRILLLFRISRQATGDFASQAPRRVSIPRVVSILPHFQLRPFSIQTGNGRFRVPSPSAGLLPPSCPNSTMPSTHTIFNPDRQREISRPEPLGGSPSPKLSHLILSDRQREILCPKPLGGSPSPELSKATQLHHRLLGQATGGFASRAPRRVSIPQVVRGYTINPTSFEHLLLEPTFHSDSDSKTDQNDQTDKAANSNSQQQANNRHKYNNYPNQYDNINKHARRYWK